MALAGELQLGWPGSWVHVHLLVRDVAHETLALRAQCAGGRTLPTLPSLSRVLVWQPHRWRSVNCDERVQRAV